MNWDDLTRRYRAALNGFLAFFTGSATGGHEDESTTEGTASTDPGTGDRDEGAARPPDEVPMPANAEAPPTNSGAVVLGAADTGPQHGLRTVPSEAPVANEFYASDSFELLVGVWEQAGQALVQSFPAIHQSPRQETLRSHLRFLARNPNNQALGGGNPWVPYHVAALYETAPDPTAVGSWEDAYAGYREVMTANHPPGNWLNRDFVDANRHLDRTAINQILDEGLGNWTQRPSSERLRAWRNRQERQPPGGPDTVAVAPASQQPPVAPGAVGVMSASGATDLNRTPTERGKRGDGDIALEALVRFLGYGRLDASVWFIGIEEGVGPDTDEGSLERNVRIRSTFDVTMDLRSVQERLGHPVADTVTQVWRNAARIALGLAGPPDETDPDYPDLPSSRSAAAWATANLGAAAQSAATGTLVGEVYPLPAKGLDTWPAALYERLFGFVNEASYRREMGDKRSAMWLEAIRTHKPAVVVIHGCTPERGPRRLLGERLIAGNWEVLLNGETGLSRLLRQQLGQTQVLSCMSLAARGATKAEMAALVLAARESLPP